jgi:hypothetical protein
MSDSLMLGIISHDPFLLHLMTLDLRLPIGTLADLAPMREGTRHGIQCIAIAACMLPILTPG